MKTRSPEGKNPAEEALLIQRLRDVESRNAAGPAKLSLHDLPEGIANQINPPPITEASFETGSDTTEDETETLEVYEDY